MKRALKVASALAALAVAVLLLHEPLRRLAARGELYLRGGVRYVFDVEVDRSLEAHARIDGTARILASRFSRFTGRPAFSRIDADQLLIDVPLSSASALTPQSIAALSVQALLKLQAVDDNSRLADSTSVLPAGVELDWDRYSRRDGGVIAAPFFQSASREALVEFARRRVPGGRDLAFARTPKGFRTFLLYQPEVTGDDIADARVAFDRGRPYVSVNFKPAGTERFRKLTAANVDKRIAISLDGIVASAPVVINEISGGNCSIHLGQARPVLEALQEAKDLSLTLKAGALPLPVRLAATRPILPRAH